MLKFPFIGCVTRDLFDKKKRQRVVAKCSARAIGIVGAGTLPSSIVVQRQDERDGRGGAPYVDLEPLKLAGLVVCGYDHALVGCRSGDDTIQCVVDGCGGEGFRFEEWSGRGPAGVRVG